MKFYETLHAHTTTSDGKMEYTKLLDVCRKNNVGVVAFTDHDSLPGKKSLDNLRKQNIADTKWVVGIEISSGLPVEIGDKATSSLHVVGLFVDPFNKDMLDHCKKAKYSREERMSRIVKNLNAIGIKITTDDCMRFSKGESVGRPHIVSAINSYPENSKVIEMYYQKMKKEAANDLNIKKIYDEMEKQSFERYPYYLFLRENSFVKDVFVDYLYYKNFDDSVNLIRNAGGLAFLAHWFTCKETIDVSFLKKILNENRLDGVETVCGLWTGQKMARKEVDDIYDMLKSLVKETGRLESGGCDAHSAADIRLFNQSDWYADKTIGMAEKIIRSSNIDKAWSSF